MKNMNRTSKMTLPVRRLYLSLMAAFISAVLLTTLLVLVHSPASAQQTTAPVAEPGSFPIRRPFGTGRDMTVALGVGDMDGDGDLDIVAGNQGEASSVAINDGKGNFPVDQLRAFGAAGDTTDLAVGDLDGDGDLDVAMSTDDGSSSRYLNDGLGNLSQGEIVAAATGAGNESKIALGDMNGDGSFDIVLTRQQGETVILENDGEAQFPATRTLGISSIGAANLALGHIDGDDLLDVVVAPLKGPATILYQRNHAFTVTHTLTATDQAGSDITADQGIRDITLGDFDGDDKLDVLTTLAGMNANGHHVLYLHSEGGTIAQSVIFGKGKGKDWSTSTGDLDGDGWLDLVIGVGEPIQVSQIHRNSGSGEFPEERRTNFGPVDQQTSAVALGDLDGDGFLDIVTGNKGHHNAIFLNDKAMSFATDVIMNDSKTATDLLIVETAARLTETNQPAGIATGDVNGDGRPDIVVGNQRELEWSPTYRSRKAALINQGDGSFRRELFGLETERTWALALADINDDGALDVISVDPNGEPISIYLNNKFGQFPSDPSISISTEGQVRPLPTSSFLGSSVTAGELDGAPGIDLVVCSNTYGCFVFLNRGDSGDAERFANASVLGGVTEPTVAVALADVNTDGRLDIVVGNHGMANYVYPNDGFGRFPVEARRSFGTGVEFTRAIAIADINGDSKPDILVGNFFGSGGVYLNDGNGNFPIALARPVGKFYDRTYGIAAEDINGDGAMDFVIGNWGIDAQPAQDALFINNGSGSFVSTRLPGQNWTRGVVLGDMDGNGTLDVIEANRFGGVRLAIHYNRLRTPARMSNRPATIVFTGTTNVDNTASQLSTTSFVTVTFMLKDSERERIGRVLFEYSLDGGGDWLPAKTLGKFYISGRRISGERGRWRPIKIPSTGTLEHLQTSPSGTVYQFVWDLGASGVVGKSDNVVLRARAYSQPVQSTEQGRYRYTNAVPSLNQWPYATVTTAPFSVRGMQIVVHGTPSAISNTLPVTNALVYLIPTGKERGETPLGGLDAPFRTAANGFLPGRAQIQLGDQLVALWPSTAVSETTPVRLYASPDDFPMTGSLIASRLVVADGGRIGAINIWADISTTLPITLSLITPLKEQLTLQSGSLPAGETLCNEVQTEQSCSLAARHIFTPTLSVPPNPLANGVWTLELRSSPTLTEPTQLLGWGMALKLSPLHFTSAEPIISGLNAYTVTAGGVQTLTVSGENPLLLFDLNVALEWNAINDERYQSQLSADLRRTSELLYDWSNGQIALGNVRVYHDARRNTLPDGTNAWNNAHIRIYASNRLRPNADQGGIISNEVTETVTISHKAEVISYLPGQVRMSATWNRFGDAASGNIGDDWPAALAHELGHYLLFLDDNYLTLEDNLLVPLGDDECRGAMNNPYSNVYSEFHPKQGWDDPQPNFDTRCNETLSELNTGRPDWETITKFYPWLQSSVGSFSEVLPGPSLLPLAVTQVAFQAPDPASDPMTWMKQLYGRPGESADSVYYRLCESANGLTHRADARKVDGSLLSFECSAEAITNTQPLEVPIFYIKGTDIDRTRDGQMRAFLFRGLPYPALVDLGQPVGDQVVALGARPDDRLCVYDLANQRVGCKRITPGDDQVQMTYIEGWQPQIIISPESSRTLQIMVTLPVTVAANGELTLTARLYPVDAPAPAPITMTLANTGTQIVYSVRFTTETPALEGYVLIGENRGAGVGVNPRQAVAEFAIGGNPVRIRARRSPTDPSNVRVRARRVRIRARRAPASSTDGQVMIYPDEEKLTPDREWSFALQPATRLPAELPWATQIGRAYWLATSANITDVGNSSIAFEYLRSDVPPGEESFIRMYFWEEKDGALCPLRAAPCWRLLDEQKTYPGHNIVSARLAGPGLYALFSHIEIPLQHGWNLIGYPVHGARSISDALASIADQYSIVVGLDDARVDDSWKAYAPDEDLGGSELGGMRFGHGYWIYVDGQTSITESVMLLLKGNVVATSSPITSAISSVSPVPLVVESGEVVELLDSIPQPTAVAAADIGIHAECQQVVRNGDFEADGEWVRPITRNRGQLLELDEVHGRSLVLGVQPEEPTPQNLVYSTGYQERVLLPRDALTITLTFAAQTDGNESLQGRVVRIFRNDWAGRPLASFPIDRSTDWQTLTLDLTPYKGRTVNLYFEVTNGQTDDARWLAVDEVGIYVCE